MAARELDMDPGFISLYLNPSDIFFLDILLEGFGHLGVPTTVDRQLGYVVIRSTPDTREEVLRILANFPRPIKVVDGAEGPTS